MEIAQADGAFMDQAKETKEGLNADCATVSGTNLHCTTNKSDSNLIE
jgi:hypothetical protein